MPSENGCDDQCAHAPELLIRPLCCLKNPCPFEGCPRCSAEIKRIKMTCKRCRHVVYRLRKNADIPCPNCYGEGADA